MQSVSITEFEKRNFETEKGQVSKPEMGNYKDMYEEGESG
jgi:hypothetical protein